MKKLTPAQAYAAHLKASKRAEALERRNPEIAADNVRIKAMYNGTEITKPRQIKATTGKKIRWVSAEIDFAIVVYLKYTKGTSSALNNPKAVAEVQIAYPARNYGAVNMLFGQIRGLDAQAPQEGLTDTSETLVNKLYTIDPIRFPGGATKEEKVINALDNLLAEIRG